MVGVFAGLKWRLVSSRIRAAGGAAKVWMIIGWCAVVLVLALVVVGFRRLRTDPSLAYTTIVSLFTVQMVSWCSRRWSPSASTRRSIRPGSPCSRSAPRRCSGDCWSPR